VARDIGFAVANREPLQRVLPAPVGLPRVATLPIEILELDLSSAAAPAALRAAKAPIAAPLRAS